MHKKEKLINTKFLKVQFPVHKLRYMYMIQNTKFLGVCSMSVIDAHDSFYKIKQLALLFQCFWRGLQLLAMQPNVIFSVVPFCFISLQVSFNVSVEARGCAPRGNNQSFTVKPVGFKDYLEVSVDYQCDCGCSRTAQTNSSICNSIGTSCLIFWSNFTWIYNLTNSCPITLDQLLVCFCLHDLKTGLNVLKRAD